MTTETDEGAGRAMDSSRIVKHPTDKEFLERLTWAENEHDTKAQAAECIYLWGFADACRNYDAELNNLKRQNAELLAAAQEYADAETIKLLPATIPVFSKLHRLIEAIARATNQPGTAPDRNTP